MGWTASSTRSFAFYALEIIGHLPLHIPCITRRLCDIATYALLRTSAHLRRLKREYSRASCSTVTPHSHHQLFIAITSSHHYMLLKLHYCSHTTFAHFRFTSANVPALRAPMSPCSRAIDTSLSPHCNHLHIIQAVVTIISPSLYCVCTHQSRFAHPLLYRAFTPL
jgi:hypothetical protein